ncbi:hypothetical protein B0T20DRAFT_392354 [Sordaria brevicollis]|uniref:Uncharacterized protein n=1 Tax=Sordaria brevicollis TaxID=83679 RepID=A0AAE0PGE2_SORBR|nr:hypothetical protein B0T20DRAFT_392354 [Sordaria brevicollis]
MPSSTHRPTLRRTQATRSLRQAASRANPQGQTVTANNSQVAETNNNQVVDRLNERVGLLNFLEENPTDHIQEQEIEEDIKDPVPAYTPTPGPGENTIEVVSAGHHYRIAEMEGPSPPPYKRKRNKLQKRRPEDRR